MKGDFVDVRIEVGVAYLEIVGEDGPEARTLWVWEESYEKD